LVAKIVSPPPGGLFGRGNIIWGASSRPVRGAMQIPDEADETDSESECVDGVNCGEDHDQDGPLLGCGITL